MTDPGPARGDPRYGGFHLSDRAVLHGMLVSVVIANLFSIAVAIGSGFRFGGVFASWLAFALLWALAMVALRFRRRLPWAKTAHIEPVVAAARGAGLLSRVRFVAAVAFVQTTFVFVLVALITSSPSRLLLGGALAGAYALTAIAIWSLNRVDMETSGVEW